MQLSKKKKYFSNFLLHFGNVNSTLNMFKEKITLIADVFSK